MGVVATAGGNIPGDSNAHLVEIPAIVFFIVTPIFIGIRFWARSVLRTGWGLDDLTIIASFICCLIVSILMMVSVYYGFGQHLKNLSTDNRLMALKIFYVAQIFYKITINLTKVSILLLYLRIFVQKYFRVCCYVLLGIILAYTVATAGSSIWQCTPVARAWDKSIPGTCISLTMNWYANAGFSIATDLLIILLPQHVLWTSKLPAFQKRALMLIFGLGLFCTVTSVLRMTTLDFSTTSPDTTFDIASTLWTIIEDNVAIVCTCLPMLRLPLSYLFPSLFGSRDGSTNASGYGKRSNQRSNHASAHASVLDHDHSGAELNDWPPEKRGKLTTSVRGKGMPDQDGASEEYILSGARERGDSGYEDTPGRITIETTTSQHFAAAR